MDLETFAAMREWPPIPEDPNDVMLMVAQGALVMDYDLLLYLWARSAGAV